MDRRKPKQEGSRGHQGKDGEMEPKLTFLVQDQAEEPDEEPAYWKKRGESLMVRPQRGENTIKQRYVACSLVQLEK